MTTTSDSSIAFEDPASEPSLRVVAVQPLIKLKEEPIAIDAKEEPKASINPIAV